MTGLLIACFVGNSLNIDVFLLFYKKICLKECETKFLSRLSHKVCRRLSSPVLLRKFTIFERCNGTIMGLTLKASRRRGRWERREGEKKETHLPAHALPLFYILKISGKLKKITSYADFLRRSPKNVCVGGYKRDYFGRSKPGCHGLLRVLDSESLLAEASFLCYSEPLLAGKTVGTVP